MIHRMTLERWWATFGFLFFCFGFFNLCTVWVTALLVHVCTQWELSPDSLRHCESTHKAFSDTLLTLLHKLERTLQLPLFLTQFLPPANAGLLWNSVALHAEVVRDLFLQMPCVYAWGAVQRFSSRVYRSNSGRLKSCWRGSRSRRLSSEWSIIA